MAYAAYPACVNFSMWYTRQNSDDWPITFVCDIRIVLRSRRVAMGRLHYAVKRSERSASSSVKRASQTGAFDLIRWCLAVRSACGPAECSGAGEKPR